MTALVYYRPPEFTFADRPPLTNADRRAAFTLADIEDAARHACRMAQFVSWGSDIWDKYETARAAVVEHLYTAEELPTFHELAVVGMTAIGRMAWRNSRQTGQDHSRNRTMPGFVRYWWWHTQRASSPESMVVDRTALWQIWSQLGQLQQDTLVAVAEHPDYASAAAAEGCSYDTFLRRVKVAREAFYALWHEGETPSHLWARSRSVARLGDTPRAPRNSAIRNLKRRSTT